MAWRSVAHGAVGHMACNVAKHHISWHGSATPGKCHVAMGHNPCATCHPALCASDPEQLNQSTLCCGHRRDPATAATAESKALRPGHVALESLIPPCAVCRAPVPCAGARGCPAPAPPRSVTGSIGTGTAAPVLAPLPLGTLGGGCDVTMKQPGPVCHAAGDGATTRHCTPAACMGCGGEGAGT